MKIEERNNTVTLTVNLDSEVSVSSTLKFLRDNTPRNVEDSYYIRTNKIRLIKLLREFGGMIKAETIDTGLKDTKTFVEAKMKEMVVS